MTLLRCRQKCPISCIIIGKYNRSLQGEIDLKTSIINDQWSFFNRNVLQKLNDPGDFLINHLGEEIEIQELKGKKIKKVSKKPLDLHAAK